MWLSVCSCVSACVPLQVTRARAQFFQRRVRLMLYSERAHFYHRYRIRGIQVGACGCVGVPGSAVRFKIQGRRRVDDWTSVHGPGGVIWGQGEMFVGEWAVGSTEPSP